MLSGHKEPDRLVLTAPAGASGGGGGLCVGCTLRQWSFVSAPTASLVSLGNQCPGVLVVDFAPVMLALDLAASGDFFQWCLIPTSHLCLAFEAMFPLLGP